MTVHRATIEDALAAARCVAMWARVGRQSDRMARQIINAAQRAQRHRSQGERLHPYLGDGSIMAAALSLRPTQAVFTPAIGTVAVLAALGVVCPLLAADEVKRTETVDA